MLRLLIPVLGFLLCFGDALAADFNWRPARDGVAERLRGGDLVGVAADTFEAQFKVACRELAKAGRQDLCNKLRAEWLDFGRSELVAMATRERDVGDHDPYSEWVAQWYFVIEAQLGVTIMELTHLRDIWVLNFTLPVAFNADAGNVWCSEQLNNHPGDTCRDEYRRHFSGTKFQKSPDPHADDVLHHGFAPVCIYWGVDIACLAAGGGFVCGIAATAAEYASERWLTPGISNLVFDRANRDTVTMTSCYCDCDGGGCDDGDDDQAEQVGEVGSISDCFGTGVQEVGPNDSIEVLQPHRTEM
jgi:hypothetical protein